MAFGVIFLHNKVDKSEVIFTKKIYLKKPKRISSPLHHLQCIFGILNA
jgi:hypothetical protein